MGRCKQNPPTNRTRKRNMTYQQMASLYDQFMVDAPYDKWLDFTKDVFASSGRNIQHVADLGCGTGEITIHLAKKGFHMYGIDYSSDMLTYAAQKGMTNNLPIQWLHQDLRELEGFGNLDAAVSYCDVINYITSEGELKTVFSRIADALKAGGLFIFDVHSLEYVTQHLVNHTFADVTNDISYIWDCTKGSEPGEMYHDLTFFSRDANDKYDRFDEFHHQRTFSIDLYQQLLTRSGFEKPKIYGDFSFKKEEQIEKAERIFFVTSKK